MICGELSKVAGLFSAWTNALWVGLLFGRDSRALSARGKRLGRRGAPPALVPVAAARIARLESLPLWGPVPPAARAAWTSRRTLDLSVVYWPRVERGNTGSEVRAHQVSQAHQAAVNLLRTARDVLPFEGVTACRRSLMQGLVKADRRAVRQSLWRLTRQQPRRVEGEAWRLLAACLKIDPRHLRELGRVRQRAALTA